MDLNDLIESVDIVEYISQYVDLTQRGDEWWGLSCFKNERTPSFSVRQHPPRFYDYSSGIGGNVYTFIRYYNKCSPKEAVEILKKYAGYDGNLSEPRQRISASLVCKRFQKPRQNVKESKSVILPNDVMLKYEKDEDRLKVWEKEGISRQSLDKFQVYYDGFSNRLVYPIRNMDGKIVNIGGRTLDPDWKEKNQRKYCYFYSWGTMNTIYGLFENLEEVKKAREVILFEGCKSVLMADTWGIHNTGAILTSHLNPNQMKILARLGCRVVFALDKDVRVADDHNIQKLKRYVNVEFIRDTQNLLDEKDSPVDKGAETFKTLYEQRIKFR